MDCPFQNNSFIQIECGTVQVPENHAEPDGASITLALAILRSPAKDKYAEPLLYIEGGPAPVVWRAPLKALEFAHFLTNRDVMVFDGRGMGLSQPRISCIPYDTPESIFQGDLFVPGFTEKVQQCRAELAAKNIRPEHFTSEQYAADVAWLTQYLGYEQLDIYSASYGTLPAFILLRDFPQAQVRSVILDSPLPPSENQYEQAPYIFERLFTEFVATCQADFVCSTAYPHLRDTYIATYNQLKAEPIILSLENGRTLMYTARMFANSVYGHLANQPSTGTLAELPGFIKEVAAGNYDKLSTGYNRIYDILATQSQMSLPDIASASTLTCANFGATTTREKIEATLAQHPEVFWYTSPYFGIEGYNICETWGMPPAASTAPAISDVPTLLLTGQFDSLTPPEWGERAAAALSHSFLYELRGQGHTPGTTACGKNIIMNFLATPTQAPDISCLAGLGLPAFSMSASVTRPPIQVGALILAGVSLFFVGQMLLAVLQSRHSIAWRANRRYANGLASILSLGVMVLFVTDTESRYLPPEMSAAGVLTVVLPLAIALQVALVFSPEDEPGLEMLLALPRPLAWLILERVTIIWLTQSGVALVGAGIVLSQNPHTDLLTLLIGWIPAALFLSGVALYLTQRSRVMAFGMALSGVLWMAFGLFGKLFLPGQPYGFPLNLIQPFLWSIHLFLAPSQVIASDYWLNRLFLTGAGMVFYGVAIAQVRDSEQVLLNAHQRQRRKSADSEPEKRVVAKLKSGIVVKPVSVSIAPLRQMLAIAWFDTKMQWRRRGMRVLALTIALGIGAFAFLGGDSLRQGVPLLTTNEFMPQDQVLMTNALSLVMALAAIANVMMLFIAPLLVADSVPLDTQQGMMETLNSLPVTSATYLIGKTLGVCLALSLALLSGSAGAMLIWWLRMGMFNLLPVFDAILTVTLPLTIITVGLATLIGATQPSRRRAILLVIFALVLPSFVPPTILNGSFLEVLLPARLSLFIHTVSNPLAQMAQLTPNFILAPQWNYAVVQRSLLIGFLQLLVMGVVVWLYRKGRVKS